ncbi:hypothetical protein [Mycolicibacter terrae]|nr:hypothetical protein [Mycolicibacter terrae]
MNLRVDRLGRLVIPEALRAALGVTPDSRRTYRVLEVPYQFVD